MYGKLCSFFPISTHELRVDSAMNDSALVTRRSSITKNEKRPDAETIPRTTVSISQFLETKLNKMEAHQLVSQKKV
jgi:hypothetical protein